jgi:uncharacterized RDD family membrane protein YckC
MSESPDLAPSTNLNSLAPRPVGLSAHAAALFADAMLVYLLLNALLGCARAALILGHSNLPDTTLELGRWAMYLIYGASEILFAASAGKWLVSITIRRADSAPAARLRLAVRSGIKYAPLFLFATGAAIRFVDEWFRRQSTVSALFAARAERLAMVAAGIVALGSLLALFPSRRTLHDWVAGTAVFHDMEIARDVHLIDRGFEVQNAVGAPLESVARLGTQTGNREAASARE